MANQQADSFYQGRRSEVIVEFFLSNLCFCNPVLTKYDVGIDLICQLYSISKDSSTKLLKPTNMFAIQIKSKSLKDKIILDKKELSYINSLEIPFFYCIVDKESLEVSLYSSQQLRNLAHMYGNFKELEQEMKIKITFVDDYSQKNIEKLNQSIKYKINEIINSDLVEEKTKEGNKYYQMNFELGPKIISFKGDESGNKREEFIEKIKKHIHSEIFNISNHKFFIPYNSTYFGENGFGFQGYYHPQNYERNIYIKTLPRLFQILSHKKEIGEYEQEKEFIDKFITSVIKKVKIEEVSNPIENAWTRYWVELINNEFDKD